MSCFVVNVTKFTQDTNVLDDHYARNRRPRPPSPNRLQGLQAPNRRNATPDANESDDSVRPRRQKRNSKAPKPDYCTDPSQLGFYPAKWTDFLEECKVEVRTYAAIREPWPSSKEATEGFISEMVEMTVRKWRRERRKAEKRYYPKYQKYMCKLVRISTLISLASLTLHSFSRISLHGEAS